MFQQDDGSSSITSLSPRQPGFPAPMPISPGPGEFGSFFRHWFKDMKPEERGLYLIHLLLTCANHVAAGALENANVALDQISQLASPDGDTMQRIASYYAEALADRILRTWPGLYKALHSTKLPALSDDVLAKKMLHDLFPFLKVAYTVTNQAILEAMEGEKLVHIIDLNAAEPSQWLPLLQDLSARPDGPPHLRITGVHPHREALDQTASALTREAERLDIPFQFNPIVAKLENLDFQQLRVKTGEALAITSSLQLHTLLACTEEHGNNIHPRKLREFVESLRSLSPKITVITEQESNHNGQSLMERLSESLYYYAALFDCLESTLPRTSSERIKAEKMLLGEEIKNIIACEGIERKERHEKLEKWFWRIGSAGFWNVPLSYYALLHARRYLQSCRCHNGYNIKEENGCVVICWQDRALFSVSAWRCRR